MIKGFFASFSLVVLDIEEQSDILLMVKLIYILK
jgi:hypothetical protein